MVCLRNVAVYIFSVENISIPWWHTYLIYFISNCLIFFSSHIFHKKNVIKLLDNSVEPILASMIITRTGQILAAANFNFQQIYVFVLQNEGGHKFLAG